MNILPAQSGLLVRLMDVSELRHRVISHNLANVNTPGYHRLEVAFEDVLAKASRDGGREGESVGPVVQEEEGLPSRADGNNVDIDREAVQLQKNALAYQTYSHILNSQMQIMRKAVEG